MIWDALTLQLGYNATLVTVGAALLGMAAGATGSFLFWASGRWLATRSATPRCRGWP